MKTMRGKAIGLVTLLAAAVAGAGCNLEPSVPDQPGYEADIKPILEARCIRCHGVPQVGGASAYPGYWFDFYECPTPAGACMKAAKDLAMRFKCRSEASCGSQMPPKPAAPLSPYQIDTIAKWADGGAAP
jgi:hypothetical protein